MPQVVVTIDSKTYRMACGEGEETRLTALAAEVDRRIVELKESFGQIGDLRLAVMAAIMTTDELGELRRRVDELEAGAGTDARRSSEMEAARGRDAARFSQSLEEAAEALDRVSRRLVEG
ncbi:cell division protein ZapA [Aurantimonas sp. Leaf443]|uniref:cell division protein ZapA n=1 Tax=Aurantimonas sp. Leaf443 TaxID=1736378 RepID=UPI0006F994B7|nr:cell division protein ZapA [Aurantimonas sp. Leaf443]KQT85916.1 cell division protein ZapA [Aurantimonas sp. Leaf443]